MFNLIKQQKQIYSSLIVSNFGHEAFGFSDEITSSEAEEAMKDKTSMAVLINTRKINLNNQDHINLAVKFLKEMSLENPSGMITEEQLGSLFKGTTESALNNLASLILLGARGGQSKVDALNNFLKKNSGNATRAPLSLLPNGTTTTAPRLSNTPQQSPETKGLREDSLDAILTNFENVVKPIRERAVSEQKPLSAQDRQKIIEAEKLATTQIRRITKAGTNNVRERQDIIKNIQIQTAELLNPIKPENTKEAMSSTNASTIFSEGKIREKRTNVIKSLGSETQKSLQDILKNPHLGSIADRLISMAPKDENGKESFVSEFFSSNYSEMSAYLQTLGYKPYKDFSYSKEISAVYFTIIDYVSTQKNVIGLGREEQLKILFDFDKDGIIDNNLSFSIGESQAFYNAMKKDKGASVDNLFENLGLVSLAAFSIKMAENLYSAREAFKNLLGAQIQMGVKPEELMKKGGSKEAIDGMYSKLSDKINGVNGTLEKSPKLAKKLETITDKAQREQALSSIKLAAVGILVGSSYGIGASIDVSEFTDHIIDSVQVGVSTAGWIVGISKEIFNRDGYGAYFNLSTIGPSLSGTKVFDNGLAFGAGVSIVGVFGTIGYEDMSIDSSKGIEKEVRNSSKILEIVVEDIYNGKTFKQSKFSKMKGSNQVFYEGFQNAYYNYGGSHGKQFLVDLTNAYLAEYRNQLYNQAQGFKFTSIGVGVAYGFLNPILAIFGYVGAESISQSYKPLTHRIEDERKASAVKMSPSEIGYEKARYKTFDVSRVSEKDGEIFNISHPDGKVEAVREGGYLYFSGTINTLEFDRHVVNGAVIKTIVINGGEKLPNGLYDPAEFTPITKNVKSEISRDPKIIELTQNAIDKTRGARNNLFNIIDYDALNHENTPGMQRLQKLAFDYKNGRGDLNTVWEAFLQAFVRNQKIDLYAAQRVPNATDELAKLRSFVSGELSQFDKILLIQSVPACLMKKPGLRIGGDNRVNVPGGLRAHDNRDEFFNRILASKFPSLIGNISKARTEWFGVNGNATSYSFKDVSDGSIAFSATQSKKKDGITNNVSGVMMYEGAYHVVDAGTPFIDMAGKPDEVVNDLSEAYLTNLLEKLRELKSKGYNIPNIPANTREVKKFIIRGGGGDIEISSKLKYCKMGECMNDAVVIDLEMKAKGGVVDIGATMTNDVYAAKETVTQYGIVGAAPVKDFSKEDTTSSGETGETGPGETGETGTTGPGETGETGPSGPTTTPGTQLVTPPTQTPTPQTPQTPTPQTPQTPTTYTSNRG